MTCIINGKIFQVKQTGNKFFYWSTLACRWIPIARSQVDFENDPMEDFNYVGSKHHY